MECTKEGCTNNATHQARLILLPPEAYGDEPVIATADVQACTEHSTEDSAKALLHSGAKKLLNETLSNAGKVEPCWKRSYAEWVRLDS